MIRRRISRKKNYIKYYYSNLNKNLYKNLFKKKLIRFKNVAFFDLFLKKIFSILICTGKKIKVIQIFLNWIRILKFLFFKKLKFDNLKKRKLALKSLFKNKKFKLEKNKIKKLKINTKNIFKHSKIKLESNKNFNNKFKNKRFIKKFKNKLRIKNKKFIKKFKNKIKNKKFKKKFIKKFKNKFKNKIKNKKFKKKFKIKNKKFKKKFKIKNKKFIRKWKMKNEKLIKKQKNKNKTSFYFGIYKLVLVNRLQKIICPKIGYKSFFKRGVLNKMPSVTNSTLKDKDKAYTLVSFWLKKAILARKEKTFILKFYSELFDINLKKGSTYRQKIEYYKILYKNRKFYKFKKWI